MLIPCLASKSAATRLAISLPATQTAMAPLGSQTVPSTVRRVISAHHWLRVLASWVTPSVQSAHAKYLGGPSHLRFGGGLHVCCGAPLARLELSLLYEQLTSRAPALAMHHPANEVQWNTATTVRRLVALSLDPQPVSAPG